jgi:hypothetical protein
VPEGAAELAVGDGLQPHVLLHLDDIEDRFVLDRLQFGGGDGVVVIMRVARGLDAVGPQEAADDIGAIGGLADGLASSSLGCK